LKNTPFRPISALGSNFNPRNTQCIPAVKIIARLELNHNWAFLQKSQGFESAFYNVLKGGFFK
jgi:hypothetical protein